MNLFPSLLLCVILYAVSNPVEATHSHDTIISTVKAHSLALQKTLIGKKRPIVIPDSDQIQKTLWLFEDDLIEYCFVSAPQVPEVQPIKRYIYWLATLQAKQNFYGYHQDIIEHSQPGHIDLLYFIYGIDIASSLTGQMLSVHIDLEMLFAQTISTTAKSIKAINEQKTQEYTQAIVHAHQEMTNYTYAVQPSLFHIWDQTLSGLLPRTGILSVLKNWIHI